MDHSLRDCETRQLTDRAGASVLSLEPVGGAKTSVQKTPLRIALVGNFAPRKCGIATFTTDTWEQLRVFQPEIKLDIYALQDANDAVVHDHAHAEIDRDSRGAYMAAARRMNEEGVDSVWLQHEFGIFGGENGDYVLDLVERVAAPLIVTMHTVLSQPSPKQEEIARRLIARASRLMVMCWTGRQLLIDRYGADPRRVQVIEHGAPDRPLVSTREREPGAFRLMTFGLLGPGKGLETAIEALPAIVERHPGTVYRIAGASHPNELRHNGERYRQSLEDLAERLGVSRHIEWVNRFLDTDEVIGMIEDCDIYLTPYPNLQQATSGTLSYAVALGRAVVSTPYIHARELLGDIGGELVEANDPAAIAKAVVRLLDNPEELQALQLRTYRRGRKTVWRHFAANTRALLDAAVAPTDSGIAVNERAAPGLAAFHALCDGTGMLQHGSYIVPDRNHGYCLDDNVRALMLVHRIAWSNPSEELQRASTFASFIQHAWNPEERRFRNFMNFDRSWSESIGSEDSNGRAVWALGDCVANSRLPQLSRWAFQMFERHAAIALEFGSPRAVAFAALGAVAMLERDPRNPLAQSVVQYCGDLLEKLLGGTRRPDWTWFEAMVGYDNPRLSQALIDCGSIAGRREWVQAGLSSLRWIMERQTSATGHFRPVGSESFGLTRDILPFDQQPLEAWAAIDACVSARRCDEGDGQLWMEHGRRAYRWYLGENDRGVVLGDIRFGACLDGVTPHGANENCGAESLLAFQLAYYSYEKLMGCTAPQWRENAVTGNQK